MGNRVSEPFFSGLFFNLCVKQMRYHMPLCVAHIPPGSTHTARLKTATLIQKHSPFLLDSFD
jgi:hypothetical protein